MAGSRAGTSAAIGRRSDDSFELEGEAASFNSVFFGFLDQESQESPENSCDSGKIQTYEDDEEDGEGGFNVEENKAFWNSQDELLQATLRRTSSIESKVRHATKDALREINMESMQCACRSPVTGGCRNCIQREICNRLRNVGFDSAICKSKWKSSSETPSGEHSYLEVVDNSSKKGEVRMVIELNFRAEFEMARASEEYNRLISRLPEVFIGKSERLRALIKILCTAAKRCMKDKKMHLGPWRKHKYMQAKWLGTCERIALAPPLVAAVFQDPPPRKSKSSMLTFDLVENLPALHCSTAVAVV